MASIDLNADLGEQPGPTGEALDAELLAIVSSANVATGGHAGTRESMARVCKLAASNGVAIGAHISFPDRDNFGRSPMTIGTDELVASLASQLEDLIDAAAASHTQVSYVKPHGALYNLASTDPVLAETVVSAIDGYGLPVLSLPHSELRRAAERFGLASFAEAFVDRNYTDAGTLQPRSKPDAMLTDPGQVSKRAVALALHRPVTTVTGSQLRIAPDSLCLHSDNANAVESASLVRATLIDVGIEIASFVAPNTQPPMRYRLVGRDAVLLLLPRPQLRHEVASIGSDSVTGLSELVPGAETVLARFDPDVTSVRALVAAIESAAQQPVESTAKAHYISVRYDGPDLAAVAETTGLTAAEVIARHAAADYLADFIGFSPGFAYLTGIDPALRLPRRSTPRSTVPSGSLAIADHYCAIYPTSSPGGWHLIGTTDSELFDQHRKPPACIQPGDSVRFQPQL